MPELPDVEIYRKYIESTALHKKIEAVEITDAALLEGATASDFARSLAGRSFEQAGVTASTASCSSMKAEAWFCISA